MDLFRSFFMNNQHLKSVFERVEVKIFVVMKFRLLDCLNFTDISSKIVIFYNI